MVHTRSQKAKEESEKDLAKQQSLAEKSQQVSVSRQLQYELKTAAVSQRDVSPQNVAEQDPARQDSAEQDIAEKAVVKQNIAEEDFSKQNMVTQAVVEKVTAEQNVAEQNIVEQNIVEQNIVEQNIVEQNIVEQNVAEQNVAEQKIVEQNIAEQDIIEQSVAEQDVTDSEDHDLSAKKIQKTKNSASIRTTIGGKTFKIPISPEDEEDFIRDSSGAVDVQNKYGLRKRTAGSSDRMKVPAAARSRLIKPSNALPTKKTRADKVAKARQKDSNKSKLTIKLSLKGKVLATLVTKKKKIMLKRVKTPRDFFTNQYHFKLRWTPFEEYPYVKEKTYQDVYNLLVDSLIPFGISLDRKNTDPTVVGEPQGPMHANDAVTVDAVVKVIMSQATDNSNALLAQARLIKAFPYTVDGKAVAGKIPNYHDVRTADFTKLADVLAPAGLHKKRAEIIRECLTAIRQKNIDANSPGCSMDSNPLNVADFVPGSLSLDYLKKLGTQEMFDELVSLPGIGVKTACCIMAFNFQLPVFAVDTHVFRMVKWLGWVPEGCNVNDAAAHLDKFIPENLKYGLHQGFWHHGQKCLRCMAKNNEKTTKGWEDAVCVIEQFVKRHPKKERKSPSQKRKRGNNDEDDNDGDNSPKTKPKGRKGSKTIPFNTMTAEEAAERGYEAMEIPVNDNFDTPGANITHTRQVWVQNRV